MGDPVEKAFGLGCACECHASGREDHDFCCAGKETTPDSRRTHAPASEDFETWNKANPPLLPDAPAGASISLASIIRRERRLAWDAARKDADAVLEEIAAIARNGCPDAHCDCGWSRVLRLVRARKSK